MNNYAKSSITNNSKGSALILVLLVTTILLVMGTAALKISAKTAEFSDLEEKKTQALYIAESGINNNIENIKSAILSFYNDKANDPTATFSFDPINLQPLNGGKYDLTVTPVAGSTTEFQAVSTAYLKAKSGEVKKTVTMKFTAFEPDGTPISNDPPSLPPTQTGTKLADVFNYAVFSNNTFKITNNAYTDSYPTGNQGNIATNESINMSANATIKGDAYYYNSYTYNNNDALITGDKIKLSSLISKPAVNGNDWKDPIIEASKGQIIKDDFSDWQSTVNISNSKIDGHVTAGQSNIKLTNCVIVKNVNVYNTNLSLNNCIIEGLFKMGGEEQKNITLNISGIIWVTGNVEFNNYVTIKGTGIIVSEKKITLSNYVDAYDNGNTNLGLISLVDNNGNGVEFNNDAKMHGVIYVPEGVVHLTNNAQVYGSVAANSVEMNSYASVLYDQNLEDSPLAGALPGTTVDSGGGTPNLPTIAGIKVTEWKEN